jgi:FkbM family methyltransferase
MKNLLNTLRYIVRHPLNRARPLRAVGRYLAWQIGSRLLPGSVAVPFVGGTRLLTRRGMTGATGNLYAGLAEFEEMGLVLHALRPGDWFVDVGANIGAYTVLAAGVCGSSAVAIEPIPKTFESLQDNIRINRLEERVIARNMGAGATKGNLTFSSDLDTVNHVLAPGEATPDKTVLVPVDTLDSLIAGIEPTVIKIDVEGFEAEVVKGAFSAFRSPKLLAVIMELNDCATRYHAEGGSVYDEVLALGFTTCQYDPLTRALVRIEPEKGKACNAIFVKNEAALSDRLKTAPRRSINGVTI